MNEAAYLLAEGADIAELDKALVDFGFPVGPDHAARRGGHRRRRRRSATIMHEAFGERMAPPEAHGQAHRRTAGWAARTKKGFYTYDGKKKEVDATVYALLPARQGPQALDRGGDGRALRAADRERGRSAASARASCAARATATSAPSSASASRRSWAGRSATRTRWARGRVLERLEHYQEKYGKRFTPAPLLVDVVKEGKGFHSR